MTTTRSPSGARRTAHTDVAVVGGGVIGCFVAREVLAARPTASVTVIDKDLVAGGATRRSAGLHFPRGASAAVRAMAAESQRRLTALAAARPDLPVHPLPMTVVAAAGTRLDETYLREARLRPSVGAPHPLTQLPPGTAGWAVDGCHYADVPALTLALMAEMRPRVPVRESVTVTRLDPAVDRTQLTLSTGETLEADHTVLAPGPWLGHPAWRDLVAPIGARVKKIVALHVERAPNPDDGVVVFHEEDAFLLPYHHRGHWLFSYTCTEWDVDPERLDTALTGADLAAARDVLGRYAPHLVEHAVSGRVFCDAYHPDGPQVRPLTPTGRLVFTGAAGGSGYRLAPSLALRTVRLLEPEPASASAPDAVGAAPSDAFAPSVRKDPT